RRLALRCDVDRITFLAQPFGNKPGHARFILNQQNSHSFTPCNTLSSAKWKYALDRFIKPDLAALEDFEVVSPNYPYTRRGVWTLLPLHGARSLAPFRGAKKAPRIFHMPFRARIRLPGLVKYWSRFIDSLDRTLNNPSHLIDTCYLG